MPKFTFPGNKGRKRAKKKHQEEKLNDTQTVQPANATRSGHSNYD